MVPLKVEQYVKRLVCTNCYFAVNDDERDDSD